MAPTGKKIFFHPDKEEITRRLQSGQSTRHVVKWLQEKYPPEQYPDTTLRATKGTLQEFRRRFLEVEKDAIDIAHKENIVEIRAEQEQMHVNDLKNTVGYKEVVKSLSDQLIDMQQRMVMMDKVISERIRLHLEQSPDAFDIKRDRQLEKWIQAMRFLLQDYARLTLQQPDRIVQHNVNISGMHSYVDKVKEAIREILAEIEPTKVARFLELCDTKLGAIEQPTANEQARAYVQTAVALNAKYESIKPDESDKK